MFYVGFLYRYLHIQISIISILQFCVVIIVQFTANRSWPTFQRRERIWLLVIQRAKPCSENPSLKWIEKELPNKNKSHTMSSYIFNSKHQGNICNTHVEIKLTIVLSDVHSSTSVTLLLPLCLLGICRPLLHSSCIHPTKKKLKKHQQSSRQHNIFIFFW